jgi:hypothetical protein
MESFDRHTLQLGELCAELQLRERDVRYVLEQGFVPEGVEMTPSSGNHRQFGPAAAFWLCLVLKLKGIGIKTALAAQIATYADGALRTVTQNLGWDWQFLPSHGRFDTEHQYYVEVGDLTGIRLVTNASPSRGGQFETFDWHVIHRPRKPISNFQPCVIIRLDLTQIAKELGQAFSEKANEPIDQSRESAL